MQTVRAEGTWGYQDQDTARDNPTQQKRRRTSDVEKDRDAVSREARPRAHRAHGDCTVVELPREEEEAPTAYNRARSEGARSISTKDTINDDQRRNDIANDGSQRSTNERGKEDTTSYQVNSKTPYKEDDRSAERSAPQFLTSILSTATEDENRACQSEIHFLNRKLVSEHPPSPRLGGDRRVRVDRNHGHTAFRRGEFASRTALLARPLQS